MASDLEKNQAFHNEHTPESLHEEKRHSEPGQDEDNHFELDASELPPGYFKSSFFCGTMFGIGLGLFSGVAGFGYAAPILGVINADIGPSKDITWAALVYSLTLAVCFTIIGRVSDIFGRRWVFTAGSFLGMVGSIVCATANSVNSFIGGMTIIGIGASVQLSYFYVMGEIVPMKYRMLGNGWCYLFTVPASGVSPVIVQTLILKYPNVGWRAAYYILTGTNCLSFLCWLIFYFPPSFKMKHGKDASVLKYIKEFDYMGTVLYLGGLLIFMLGLNWGGVVYAWDSGYVIGTIVAGAAGLVLFCLWEVYANPKEPLVPMQLFKNVPWSAATILSGIAASLYYAMAIVWPAMIGSVFGNPEKVISNAWLASMMGLCINWGQILCGAFSVKIGHLKYQTIASVIICGIFIAAIAAVTPETKAMAAAFVAIGSFFAGWAESIAITAVTWTVWDQNALGSACGVAGSIRFLISAVGSTVYTVVLSARIKETIKNVPKAVVAAGLPTSSVTAFMTDLTTSGNFSNVPGISDAIIAVGVRANKLAYSQAYSTVFLTSIAFTALAVVSTFYLSDLDALLTDRVTSTLYKRGEDNKVAGEA